MTRSIKPAPNQARAAANTPEEVGRVDSRRGAYVFGRPLVDCGHAPARCRSASARGMQCRAFMWIAGTRHVAPTRCTTRPAPVGLTGADRVVCLNTSGGAAWAHLSSSALGQACLVRLEAPDDLVPEVTVDHAAADPERAFEQAGIDLAEYEWREYR